MREVQWRGATHNETSQMALEGIQASKEYVSTDDDSENWIQVNDTTVPEEHREYVLGWTVSVVTIYVLRSYWSMNRKWKKQVFVGAAGNGSRQGPSDPMLQEMKGVDFLR